MGRCPSCGKNYFLSNDFAECSWCGKKICNNCVPEWKGFFDIKFKMEKYNGSAEYVTLGFCCDSCSQSFWSSVMKYPLEEVGTDIKGFGKNIRKLFYAAVLNVLKDKPELRQVSINSVNWAIEIETESNVAILMGINDEGNVIPDSGVCGTLIQDFVKQGHSTLAQNLEECGRPLDAANIYESLRMYDKAKQLREKEKQVTVKHTAISVNLNDLLKQVQDGGIVAVYRCPHCRGTLKINKQTKLETLKTCEYCNSEIETMDLADFLKTALA